MKRIKATLCFLLLFCIIFCGCTNTDALSETVSSAPGAAVAEILADEGAKPYNAVVVLSGENVQWIDAESDVTVYTSQTALTLDSTYQITRQAELSFPIESDSVEGYCAFGDEVCLLTREKMLVYQGNSLLFEKEGTYLAAASGKDGIYLLRLEANATEEAGSWMLCLFDGNDVRELVQISDMGEFGTLCCDQDGTVYLGTSEGIVRCDLETAVCATELKWADCGIYPYDVTAIGKTTEGFLAAVAGELFSLSPGQMTSDVEPVVLHLGTLTSGQSIVSQLVSNFNRSQSEYRLETLEYPDTASLNMGILSGEIDLLHIYNIPQSAYIAKGVLEDLNPWIQQDAAVHAEDFFPTVWNAADVSGKRYSAIASFTLSGLMAPESLVGDRTGWTFSEFQSIIAGSNALQKDTKRMMLAITFDAGQYVDAASNTASFDSAAFISYLEYVDQFLLNDAEILADGEASQLTNADIISVSDTQQESYASMFWNGSSVRFLGFPSEDAGGMSIDTVSGLELGMVSTGNQEGAWAVISYALSDSFQSAASNIGLPSRIDTLHEQITAAVAASGAGGGDYSEECGNTLLELISGASGKRVWDSEISGIVEEETASFFSGDKSAEDVAEIIQNRVSIYLSEQG